MNGIKYGQIGVGHAHASKIAVYRRSPEFEVVGIVEPDPELRRKAESQAAFRGLPWLTEEQLLSVPGLKVVGVETRVRELLDTAERCVNAGLNVSIDKPAGESLAQFKRILDTAASKHLAVQMGYMYRYNPGVLLLRDFLKRGWLGEPFEVHTVVSKVLEPAARQKLHDYPGGMMFELGCHVIDLVHLIVGAPERVTAFSQHVSRQSDGLLDNMLAVLSYPKAIATVKSSAMEVDGFARRHLVVCGSEGTFHVQPLDDAPVARFAFASPRGKYSRDYQEVKFGEFHRYVADAAELARIVRGEKEPGIPYSHDYEVQKTVLAASGLPAEKASGPQKVQPQ